MKTKPKYNEFNDWEVPPTKFQAIVYMTKLLAYLAMLAILFIVSLLMIFYPLIKKFI